MSRITRTSVRTGVVLGASERYAAVMVVTAEAGWRVLCALCCIAFASCGKPPPAAAPTPVESRAPRAAALEIATSSAAVEPPPALVTGRASTPRSFAPPPRTRQERTPSLREVPAQRLSLLWKARVGLTTFRTTMAMVDRVIVVGTHGKTFGGLNEASDGVYVLEASSGKTRRFIPTPGKGDKDVGGVALDGTSGVAFTTDNGQVVRARLDDGALLWEKSLFGKVRPAPALAQLNGAGALDVVVGDENGDLYALDGDSGAVLWTRPTGTNDYDARGFVAAAAIADIDADGQDEVIAGARDGVLVAYSGRDGAERWRAGDGSGIHASPLIADLDGDGHLDVLAAWSYSRIAILDAATGDVRYEQRLEQDRVGIEGLFSSPVPLPRRDGPALLVQGTSWWGGARGKQKQDTVDGVVLAGQLAREFRSDEGRVSASAVIMDLGDDGVWDAVLGTEAGELLALGADGTRRVLGKLGGGIEATALVADVDGDQLYELLVAAQDGWLSCFRTGSRTAPLVARFRGNAADNRGSLGPVELGWALARERGELER